MEQQDNTSFDLHKYTGPLLRRKWLVIIPTVIFSIGAIIYAISLPDVYESKCVLTVKRSRVIDSVLAERGAVLDVRKALQAVREKMLSWESIIQAIKAAGIDKDIPEDDRSGLEMLYRLTLEKISLRARSQNDLIIVAYKGKDPVTNFRMVDSLVSNFMEESLISSRSEADETLAFIEGDLERLKKRLDESERKFRNFEEKHIDELPGEDSILPKLYNIKGELLEVNREISALQEKTSFLEGRKKGESKTITGEIVQIPNPRLNNLNRQIIDMEIEITMLRAKYFDDHPAIAQRQKELNRLNEMLENEAEKVVSEEKIISNPRYERMIEKEFELRLELKSLESHKKELEGMIVGLKPTIDNIPALKQELFELQSNYDVNRKLYEERLMQQSKAELVKEISLDAKNNPFNIVEPARISYKPLKDKKIKVVVMGILLGAGLGIGIVFGLEMINQRFKTAEEVQEYLQIPVLGMAPTIIIKS